MYDCLIVGVTSELLLYFLVWRNSRWHIGRKQTAQIVFPAMASIALILIFNYAKII